MSKQHLYLILLILGTACWGVSYPVTKLAVGNFSPYTFLFYRFLLATVVLALIFFKSLRQSNVQTVIAGMKFAIPLLLGITLQTIGLKHSTASQCSFIAGVCVVIVTRIESTAPQKDHCPENMAGSTHRTGGAVYHFYKRKLYNRNGRSVYHSGIIWVCGIPDQCRKIYSQ